MDGELSGALFMMSGSETRLSYTSDIDPPRPLSSREQYINSPKPSPRQSPRPSPRESPRPKPKPRASPRSSPRSFRELKAIAQSQRRFSGSVGDEDRQEGEDEDEEIVRELTLAEQFQQLQGCRYIRKRQDTNPDQVDDIDLDDVFGKK